MTKTTKIVITIISTLFLLTVIGTYTYIASQLDTKELRLTFITKIEKVFPNMKASIGEFNVEFGQSLELKTNNLKIGLKKEATLFEVKELVVKVPLFSILLGGGNVEVDIQNPRFYMNKENWAKGIANRKTKELIDVEKPEELLLPAFLANSTVAVRFNHLDILHDEKVTTINKFVIKNLGLNANAAYELKSDFKYIMDNGDILTLETFIVGSIGVEEYIENQKIPFKTSYRLDGVKVKGQDEVFPRINGNIDGVLEKEGSIKIKNSLRLDRSNLKHEVRIDNKKVEIAGIQGSLALNELNPLFAYLKLPLVMLDGFVNITGSLSTSKEQIKPNLKLNLSGVKGTIPGSEYSANGDIEITENEMTYKSLVNMYDGSTLIEGKALFEMKANSSVEERIKSMSTLIKMTDLKISSLSIREIFTGTQEDIKNKDNIIWPIFLILPNSKVKAEMINSKWDDKLISLNLDVETRGTETELKDFTVVYDKGKIEGKGTGGIYADGINLKTDVKVLDFDTNLFKNLIDQKTPALMGKVKGSISGPFSIKDGNKVYDFKIDLKSKSGHISGIDVDKEFKKLKKELQGVPLLGPSIKWKEQDITNQYKDASVLAIVKNGKINIKKITLATADNNLKITGKGPVYLGEEESLVEAKVFDDMGITQSLKKNLAMKSIPIAFKGRGIDLQLDQDYTVNKLMTHLKGKEGKAQVEKAIDKNVDKYLKGESGKQIKSLLKGFLK